MPEKQTVLEAARQHNDHDSDCGPCTPSTPCRKCRVLAALMERREKAAVKAARRMAKIEALKWVVEPVEVGPVTGHPTYRKIKDIEAEIVKLEKERAGERLG